MNGTGDARKQIVLGAGHMAPQYSTIQSIPTKLTVNDYVPPVPGRLNQPKKSSMRQPGSPDKKKSSISFGVE